MKKVKIIRPRSRTSKEISADYSMVDPRHTRKRSSQTTISLSTFIISGLNSETPSKKMAKEAEQVAKRFTRENPRLLEVHVQPKEIRMQVAQPQLAVHLGEHFSQAYKLFQPSTQVAWSRDALNKVVHVKVEFHGTRKSQTTGKTRKKPNSQELHKWKDWYAWQEKQQAKKRGGE